MPESLLLEGATEVAEDPIEVNIKGQEADLTQEPPQGKFFILFITYTIFSVL